LEVSEPMPVERAAGSKPSAAIKKTTAEKINYHCYIRFGKLIKELIVIFQEVNQ
jgi:hypothetical protein